MPKPTRPILFCLLIIFIGLAAGAVSHHYGLEEKIGLKILFMLRGVRTPPPEAVVVAMDKRSVRTIGLAREMENWPRRLHGDLIDRLDHAGARVIAFDVIFDEKRDPAHDQAFAHAIERAGNVVLGAFLQNERVLLSNADAVLETLFSPIALFSGPAAGYGPFPLPKVPLRVSQVWLFKGEDEPMPTMPVVAFQVWSLPVYPEFISLLAEANKDLSQALPLTRKEVDALENINLLIAKIRKLFKRHPQLSDSLKSALEASTGSAADKKTLRAMINLYAGEASRYINFYGPAGTLPTTSYGDVLVDHNAAGGLQITSLFEDRAVFVGRSEPVQFQKEDVFYTVYSKSDGIDISGVEIAATTFANLMEDSWIKPLDTGWHLLLILVWGGMMGGLCYFSRTVAGGLGVLGGSAAYVFFCLFLFEGGFYWFPVVVPVLVQGPAAFFAAVIVKYRRVKVERENIRKAFGYYLPEPVVRRLARDVTRVHREHHLLYGVCLSTDAQQYTQMSENMPPDALRELMNRYYEVLFAPVRAHGGGVSDVVGDAMMAIWTASAPDPSLCAAACRAALEIKDQIEKFSALEEGHRLPTRIGVHAGLVSVGSLGAGDHFEYRAVGDIVNTASRLEGLNKYLGTKILISSQVAAGLEQFLTLPLGDFLLSGKSIPVGVVELIGPNGEATPAQQERCRLFTQALDLLQNKSFDSTRLFLKKVLEIDTGDQLAAFFLEECGKYEKTPPDEAGPLVVRMVGK